MTDINVGAIVEILNDKTDRDLHNVNTGDGADAVVEYQNPTAENNYTWYRKYASGWVEQGGKTSNFTNTSAGTNDNKTVILPVVMADANYSVMITRAGSGSGWSYRELLAYDTSKTTSRFVIGEWTNAETAGTTCYAIWQVFGLAS
jgi:hypothetical protein